MKIWSSYFYNLRKADNYHWCALQELGTKYVVNSSNLQTMGIFVHMIPASTRRQYDRSCFFFSCLYVAIISKVVPIVSLLGTQPGLEIGGLDHPVIAGCSSSTAHHSPLRRVGSMLWQILHLDFRVSRTSVLQIAH